MLSWAEIQPGRPRRASLILLWKSSVVGDAPENKTVNLWRLSCVLKVKILAKVHFGVTCGTFEKMPDFLYDFHTVGCSFVGLLHVHAHSDVLLVYLFHDNYI